MSCKPRSIHAQAHGDVDFDSPAGSECDLAAIEEVDLRGWIAWALSQ